MKSSRGKERSRWQNSRFPRHIISWISRLHGDPWPFCDEETTHLKPRKRGTSVPDPSPSIQSSWAFSCTATVLSNPFLFKKLNCRAFISLGLVLIHSFLDTDTETSIYLGSWGIEFFEVYKFYCVAVLLDLHTGERMESIIFERQNRNGTRPEGFIYDNERGFWWTRVCGFWILDWGDLKC